LSGPAIRAGLVDALALPRLVRPRPNRVGVAVPLTKLLAARHILRRALEEGEPAPGGPVVAETSSGTFTPSLAMVARLQGRPLTLVGDPTVGAPRLPPRLARARPRWTTASAESAAPSDHPGSPGAAPASFIDRFPPQREAAP